MAGLTYWLYAAKFGAWLAAEGALAIGFFAVGWAVAAAIVVGLAAYAGMLLFSSDSSDDKDSTNTTNPSES